MNGKTVTNPKGRIICIGDLQGCHAEALMLLEKCNVTADDVVVFAGDLIDRGPDNDKCIDLAMQLEQRQGQASAIMGNHEDKHLHYRRKDERGQSPNVQVPSHIATRLQLKDHHYEWMKQVPMYIRLPEHNAVVVHAGVYPGIPIESQDPHHLMHIQVIQPYDKWGVRSNNTKSMWPSKAPADPLWRFWTHFWDGPERIIFGHSVLDKPLLTDKACGIDGGCCFGEELRAVILPQWEIVTVKSLSKHNSRKNYATGNDVKVYPIHGDVSTYS